MEVMKWFGHVERMDEYRMGRKVLMADVSGGRVRSRPRMSWMNGVKFTLSRKRMMVEALRQCAKDRKEWRALVRILMIECNEAILHDPAFLT